MERERREKRDEFGFSSSSRPYFFKQKKSYLAKGPRVDELDGLKVRLPRVEDLLDLDRPFEVVLELFLELENRFFFFFRGGGVKKGERRLERRRRLHQNRMLVKEKSRSKCAQAATNSDAHCSFLEPQGSLQELTRAGSTRQGYKRALKRAERLKQRLQQ